MAPCMSPKPAYGFIYKTLSCQSREAILALQQPTPAMIDNTRPTQDTGGITIARFGG